MLRVTSEHRIEEMEDIMRASAHRHGGRVLAVSHVGKGKSDPLVFTLCQSELYAPLLASDNRFAAFIPSRIAACPKADGVQLEAVSPREYCDLLGRPDLIEKAIPLEASLLAIMEDAARPVAAAARVAPGAVKGYGLGATEEQVNLRASLPQRIDCHGTKVEDLGGTGKSEAQGG
jgi:hypothetical protein